MFSYVSMFSHFSMFPHVSMFPLDCFVKKSYAGNTNKGSKIPQSPPIATSFFCRFLAIVKMKLAPFVNISLLFYLSGSRFLLS